MTRVAVVTLPGFNELDSFLALHVLNRAEGVTAFLAGPMPRAVSMNGVATEIAGTLVDAGAADAVVIGSSRETRTYAADAAFLAALQLDPARQLIAAQCSGALLLARLGLLRGLSVTTDNKTRPWLEALDLDLTVDALAVAGNVATAGGCLSAQYLVTWLLMRMVGETGTRQALDYVVPVDDGAGYATRLLDRARAADPAGLAATPEARRQAV